MRRKFTVIGKSCDFSRITPDATPKDKTTDQTELTEETWLLSPSEGGFPGMFESSQKMQQDEE